MACDPEHGSNNNNKNNNNNKKKKLPLAADVRREQTAFFRSGGLAAVDDNNENKDNDKTTKKEASPATTAKKQQQQVALIGAPEHFVENYNIRLTKYCSQATARSLTRRLRERNGGLAGVEALTLPYSDGRWEVACNLLRPDLTSTERVQQEVDKWEQEQQQQQQQTSFPMHSLVEKGYRVGTTAEQCIQALSLCSCEHHHREQYDQSVLDNFRNYIC